MKRAGRERAGKILAVCLFCGLLCFGVGRYASGEKRAEEERLRGLRYEGFDVMMEGREISALMMGEEGLWVGTSEGLLLLDRDTGEELKRLGEDLQMVYASDIVRTDDGSLWAGHSGGVTVFLPDGGRVEFAYPAIPGGRANCLETDGETVWGGTLEGAFTAHMSGGEWRVVEYLTKENGLACDPVNVIRKTGEEIWYGAYLNQTPGGISIRGERGWQYISVEEGLAHPYVNAFWQLDADRMLAATGQLMAGGLCLLEKGEKGWRVSETYDKSDGLPGEKVRWLYVSGEGWFFITTESDGLMLCESTGILEEGRGHPLRGVILQEENGLSDNEIKCIAESESFFWLGGRYGLTRVEKQAVARLLENLP